MATYHKNSDETILKINKAYDKAIKDINEDINNIFRNYQINTGLSSSEGRKILNSKISDKELASIKERIRYIKDDDIKKQLYAELNSKAYKARITRLEALKDSINVNTKRVADTELQATTKLYTNNIQDAYYRTLFDIQKGVKLGFNVAEMPDETIQEILKNNWSGEHYSKRIWNNSKVFASKLEDTLISGIMAGHSVKKIAKELEEYTSYGKFATERLTRTETTYMCNMAEIESYKECGIDKYIFLATLDLRTSKQCRQHDGKIYKVSEAKPGVNLPPLHAYCRSTTIADMDSEGLENLSRRARDPVTGKTYIVPGDMNYEEWHKKFVVNKYGENKSQAMENMIKNKSYDKAQLKKYRKVLGKESPKSLKEFQELKYNNGEEWKLTQYNYKLRKEVIDNPNVILNNADKFEISENKYLKYIFDGKNNDGLAKGRAIESRLGYNKDNYKEFDKLIKSNIGRYPARHKESTPHGEKYEVNMVVRGLKGKQAKVLVGVMDNGIPKLTTVHIDKLKESDLRYE